MTNHKTNYFLVGQQQTHKYELSHQILWSPKRAKNGSDQYKAMRMVKPGDIIFHGYSKSIHAVSVARTRAKSANRPKGLPNNTKKNWNVSGWKIKLYTIKIHFSLDTNKLSNKRYNGFFNSGPHAGNMVQKYLTLLNKNSYTYLLRNLSSKVTNKIKHFNLRMDKVSKDSLLNARPSVHEVTKKDPSKKQSKGFHKRNNHGTSSISINQSKMIYDNKAKNGVWGEYYLCQHLEDKFGLSKQYYIEGMSSIFCKSLKKKYPKKFSDIHPCKRAPKNGDDSYGCDYVVINKSNNNKYFIDAKATTNGPLEPFYMSRGEKDLLRTAKNSNNSKIYIIYRIYHLYNNAQVNTYRSNINNNGINNNPNAIKTIKMYKISPNRPKPTNK